MLDRYKNVVLVGHSLGSVIAYDAIDRIALADNENRLRACSNEEKAKIDCYEDRLKAFVTFGSPLDKVAFYFRERAAKDKYFMRQIISARHGFRAKELFPSEGEDAIPSGFRFAADSSIQENFKGIIWKNFWDPHDPVGGSLEMYLVDYRLKDGKKVDYQKKGEKEIRYRPAFLGNVKVHSHKPFWEAHGDYFSNPSVQGLL